jgi:hypothetical protein
VGNGFAAQVTLGVRQGGGGAGGLM